jgi:hypothetical protein
MKTNDLLIIGAVGVGVYLLTRPRVTYPPTYPAGYPATYPQTGLPAYNPYGGQYAGNATAQDIAAGGSALSALGDIIGNFF